VAGWDLLKGEDSPQIVLEPAASVEGDTLVEVGRAPSVEGDILLLVVKRAPWVAGSTRVRVGRAPCTGVVLEPAASVAGGTLVGVGRDHCVAGGMLPLEVGQVPLEGADNPQKAAGRAPLVDGGSPWSEMEPVVLPEECARLPALGLAVCGSSEEASLLPEGCRSPYTRALCP